MATDTSATTVFVTGASGYIAGHVIRQLLDAGYKVKGSVRSLSNETKVKHLQDTFPGVELVEADLLASGSFDAGIAGCDYVLHTASPFQLHVEDPQRDLVDPAVKGTQNVLEAAAKAGTVKRVVVTSSCAAVACEVVPDGKVLTEDDWNTDSTLEVGPYRFSKTLAERAAWGFAKDAAFDVVTINPSFVLGPPLSTRTDSTSVRLAKNLLSGAMRDGAPPAGYGTVDVRDVAKAHVEAMRRKEASGRYILSSSEGLHGMLQVAEWLRASPDLAAFHANLPTASTGTPKTPSKYSHAKAERELGIVFTPTSTSIVDMAKFLVENDMVTPPGK